MAALFSIGESEKASLEALCRIEKLLQKLCEKAECNTRANEIAAKALAREMGIPSENVPAHNTGGLEDAIYIDVSESGTITERGVETSLIDLTRSIGKPATRGYIASQAMLENGSEAGGLMQILLYRNKYDAENNKAAVSIELSAGMAHGVTADYTHAKIKRLAGNARLMFYIQ